MAVYEGECDVEVRKRAKRSADVDVETAPNGKGPKLEVGQARPLVEDKDAHDFENSDDHPPFLTLKNVSVKRFNSFERHKEYGKIFRFMRYREETKEAQVVEDGGPLHEGPICSVWTQLIRAANFPGGEPQPMGALRLIPNSANNIVKVPDGCWVASGATGPLIDGLVHWPTVVLEVAFSEPSADLAEDIRQWLVPENPVQLVIAIKIGCSPLVGGGRTMWFELHRRHKTDGGVSAPKKILPGNGRINFGLRVAQAQAPQAQAQVPQPQAPQAQAQVPQPLAPQAQAQAQAPQPQPPQAQAPITVNIPWLYFFANDAQVLRSLGLQNNSTSFDVAAAIEAVLANPNQLQVLPNYAQGHFTLNLDAVRTYPA